VANEAEAAVGEVDRLTRRIDQILALARSDSGVGDWLEVGVVAVVTARVEAATRTAEDRSLDLGLAVPENASGLSIEAPSGVLERMVDELIGNAIAYARQAIRVQVTGDGPWVVLQVDDDGPGLSQQERAGVFQRFVRGSNSVPGGSGLGLALVSESAQALGGSATAEESPLGGLRIEVRLPASPP